MKQALVLIDIQNIYFTPGKYQLFKPELAAENSSKVLHYFRENNLPVIHVKHLFDIIGNSESAYGYTDTKEYLCSINKAVEPINDEIIVEKEYPNSFHKTSLKKELDYLQIDTLVVAGMMSHMCIDTTVRTAKDFDYQITVIGDACTTLDMKYDNEIISADIAHKVFMAALNGFFAKIVSTEQFLSDSHRNL